MATRLGDFLEKQLEGEVTVAALARAAGISPSTVTQILRGEIKRPPFSRLRGFARVLGISIRRLINLFDGSDREFYLEILRERS